MPSNTDAFDVVVGNIGRVYHGAAERVARKEFNEWVKLAKAPCGRAAGEDVTLFDSNGDILREYAGRLTRAVLRECARRLTRAENKGQ